MKYWLKDDPEVVHDPWCLLIAYFITRCFELPEDTKESLGTTLVDLYIQHYKYLFPGVGAKAREVIVEEARVSWFPWVRAKIRQQESDAAEALIGAVAYSVQVYCFGFALRSGLYTVCLGMVLLWLCTHKSHDGQQAVQVEDNNQAEALPLPQNVNEEVIAVLMDNIQAEALPQPHIMNEVVQANEHPEDAAPTPFRNFALSKAGLAAVRERRKTFTALKERACAKKIQKAFRQWRNKKLMNSLAKQETASIGIVNW